MSIQDFCVQQGNDSLFDIEIDPDTLDFKATEGFETAIDFQLFVDQRVSREERANAQDRRGWIGDIVTRNEGYQVGSLLHLQEQSRDTQINNNETAAYCKNALNYLVTIGASKEITSRVVGNNIEGTIINDSNDVGRYSRLWKSPIVCDADDTPIPRTSIDILLADDGFALLTDIGENITNFTKENF